MNAATTNSTNITFRDCVLIATSPTNNASTYVGLADVAANWTFDRCYFAGVSSGNVLNLTFPTSTVADYDVNFLIQNCICLSGGNAFIGAFTSGANSFKPGGIDVFNCTIIAYVGLTCNGANHSITIPSTIYNSFILSCGSLALAAGASGQVLEDFNRIVAPTPRTNITAGASSVSNTSHAPLYEIGYEMISGRQLRPFGMPMVGSPLLGRATAAIQPPVDILSRPKPAGGLSTLYGWGAYERHDTAARETSTLYGTTSSIVITGPGDQDFAIPVDATLTTLSVFCIYDANHGTLNKPQMKVVNGEEVGVSEAAITMSLGSNQWELLTLTFTPTAKGIVTVRFISRSLSGSGKAFFDEFSY